MQSSNEIENMAFQRIQAVKRFETVLGGQQNMVDYIAQYTKELDSGYIRKINITKQKVKPW